MSEIPHDVQAKYPRLRELCGGDITHAATAGIARHIREYSPEVRAEWAAFKDEYNRNPQWFLRQLLRGLQDMG